MKVNKPALKASWKVFYEVVKLIGVIAVVVATITTIAVYGLMAEMAAGILITLILAVFGAYIYEMWTEEYHYQSRIEKTEQEVKEYRSWKGKSGTGTPSERQWP
jgi:uncharacterized membrane protein YgcG